MTFFTCSTYGVLFLFWISALIWWIVHCLLDWGRFNDHTGTSQYVRMNFEQWEKLYAVNPETYVYRYGECAWDDCRRLYARNDKCPAHHVHICFDFFSFLRWKVFWKHQEKLEARRADLRSQVESLKSLQDIVQRDIARHDEELKRLLRKES